MGIAGRGSSSPNTKPTSRARSSSVCSSVCNSNSRELIILQLNLALRFINLVSWPGDAFLHWKRSRVVERVSDLARSGISSLS